VIEHGEVEVIHNVGVGLSLDPRPGLAKVVFDNLADTFVHLS
jgi:hypothetical protein